MIQRNYYPALAVQGILMLAFQPGPAAVGQYPEGRETASELFCQ